MDGAASALMRKDTRMQTKFIAITAMALALGSFSPASRVLAQRGPATPGLTLTTTAFPGGGEIPAKYTGLADPNPLSPKLEWTNVPAMTASFVLILHDPDTSVRRSTEDILHWLVFNIPGTAREIAEGQPATATLPDGSIQAKRLGGQPGYMGPGAPAVGPLHHYTFELFALDTKLELTPEATRADIMTAMNGHVLGKAALVGRFHR